MNVKTIYNRFYGWACRRPDALAVVGDGCEVTYGELDAMADAIMSKFYDDHYDLSA